MSRTTRLNLLPHLTQLTSGDDSCEMQPAAHLRDQIRQKIKSWLAQRNRTNQAAGGFAEPPRMIHTREGIQRHVPHIHERHATLEDMNLSYSVDSVSGLVLGTG